jgi:2-dehydro-3-deoxy-D-arabinonate dehydratase
MHGSPMKLAKVRLPSGVQQIVSVDRDQLHPLNLTGGQYKSLTDILEEDDPEEVAGFLTDDSAKPIPANSVKFLAPLDQQEVWAAGVTYKRSRAARMEESDTAASCYDKVYASPRPELFMKATPHRTVGPGEPVRIRQDSEWDVPEPELTLVLNTRAKLVGYTIGNDMSSRDIEGDNPLYLPQAKVYNGCCAIGPCITLPSAMPPRDEIGIRLEIRREGQVEFQGETNLSQMARSFENLIGWLARDNSFPNGVFLMTGTGIVPDSGFTLEPGDVVNISIDGIGTLSNPVVRG